MQRADENRCGSLLRNYFSISSRNYFSCVSPSFVFVCSFQIYCTVIGTICTFYMICHFYDLLISSGVAPEARNEFERVSEQMKSLHKSFGIAADWNTVIIFIIDLIRCFTPLLFHLSGHGSVLSLNSFNSSLIH